MTLVHCSLFARAIIEEANSEAVGTRLQEYVSEASEGVVTSTGVLKVSASLKFGGLNKPHMS